MKVVFTTHRKLIVAFIYRSLEPTELVEDGFLDPDANYTAFVELIIPDSTVIGRSPYMSPRRPGDPISLQGILFVSNFIKQHMHN